MGVDQNVPPPLVPLLSPGRMAREVTQCDPFSLSSSSAAHMTEKKALVLKIN